MINELQVLLTLSLLAAVVQFKSSLYHATTADMSKRQSMNARMCMLSVR